MNIKMKPVFWENPFPGVPYSWQNPLQNPIVAQNENSYFYKLLQFNNNTHYDYF